MPRPPELGDWLVLEGWSVVAVRSTEEEADRFAEFHKCLDPLSRVVVAHVTAQATIEEDNE